jgi:Cation transporter/ATPase, N-terminus
MALRNRGAEKPSPKNVAGNGSSQLCHHIRPARQVIDVAQVRRRDTGRLSTAIKSRSRSIGYAFGIHAAFQLDCMTSSESAVADGSKLAEKDFWNHTPQEIGAALGCGLEGLGSKEAGQRLDQYGPNSDAAARADSLLRACSADCSNRCP